LGCVLLLLLGWTLSSAFSTTEAAWISELHLPQTASHPEAIELSELVPGQTYDLIVLNGNAGRGSHQVIYQQSLTPDRTTLLLSDTPAESWPEPWLEIAPEAWVPLTTPNSETPNLERAAIVLLYSGATGLAPIYQSIYAQQLGAYTPTGDQFHHLLDYVVLTPTGTAAEWPTDHLTPRSPIVTENNTVVTRLQTPFARSTAPTYFTGTPNTQGVMPVGDGFTYRINPGLPNLEQLDHMPEPTTAALLGLGTLLLARRSR